MFFVYIMQSLKDHRRYIGHTNNLLRRLEDHNRGKTKSVRNRGPFKLIHQESYNTRAEALAREKQIKKYKGGEALRKLIKGEFSGSSAGFEPAGRN